MLMPSWLSTAAAAGLYLPLAAALGGQLYVQPYGYHEAERDVIRCAEHVCVSQMTGWIVSIPTHAPCTCCQTWLASHLKQAA